MPLSSLQSPIPEATTDPPLDPALSPALKNRIDGPQADLREGVFRRLIFLPAGGVGPAHLLISVTGVPAQWMLIKFCWH